MKKQSHFSTGLLTGAIIAAALLFSVYYVPRKGLLFQKDPFSFAVVLDNAYGLKSGSPVLIQGLEAGEITDIKIQELDVLGYKVIASVKIFDKAQYHDMLHVDSIYQVAQSGLLSETTLTIVPGGQGPSVEQQLVEGLPPTDFTQILDHLATVSKRVADFMDGGKPGDPNLRRALLDLQQSLRNVRDFSEKLPR